MCSVEGQGIYIQMLGGGHYGEWVSIPPPAILHRYAECCQARWSPPSTPGTSTSSTRKPIMCPPASSLTLPSQQIPNHSHSPPPHKPQLPLSTIALPILAINYFDGTSEDEAGNDDDDQDGQEDQAGWLPPAATNPKLPADSTHFTLQSTSAHFLQSHFVLQRPSPFYCRHCELPSLRNSWPGCSSVTMTLCGQARQTDSPSVSISLGLIGLSCNLLRLPEIGQRL